MLIAKILLIAALFFVSFAEKTNYSRLSRILELNGERSLRVKKRQEEPEYFEQCRFVNTWKEHLGHVSVLAFLDPSWQYSFRQAVMLNVLSSRLKKSGFADIRFFVISPSPDLRQDKSEDDDEIEAWRQIATIFPDTENFVNTSIHIFKEDESEIIFLQDGPQFQMWKRFRALRDQVIVIDRCGRLTYQVIVPWSILHFPYVKAAILSTHQEDPCGECNPSLYKVPEYKEYLSGLTNSTEEETDLREVDNVNVDLIRITENLENATLRFNEPLKQEHRLNIVSPVSLDQTTNSSIANTDRLDLVNMTELSVKSAYQYDNNTTEFSIGKSHPDTAESQEKLTNSSHDNETIATIFESQENVFAQQEMFTSRKNNSADYEGMRNRILMLDEPIARNNVTSDGISTIETTISDAPNDDEVSSGDRHVGSDNLTKCGQHDAVDENEVNDVRIEKVHSFSLSLRIVMYAPHEHKNGKKTKKYTHLILKTDNPDYHRHIDSGIDVTSPTDLLQDSDLQIVNSKEYDQTGIEITEKYIFDQDESPGLYGEIADYWRSYEDSDITDRNETSNDNYKNSTISYNEQHRNNISDHSTNFSSEVDKSYSIANIAMDTNTENSVSPQNVIRLNEINSLGSINQNEQIDRQNETRNKLIEHYSKLLAWIDYKLNK